MSESAPYYPIILVRGFDPLRGSIKDPYYGFNDGTVYYRETHHNRIYEGFVINFLKDEKHGYIDTSNVFTFGEAEAPKYHSFYVNEVMTGPNSSFPEPGSERAMKTFWVFRFYDAIEEEKLQVKNVRLIPYFARELHRFIIEVKKLTGAPMVNIIAHSMGGVITRHVIQRRYPFKDGKEAEKHIHRIISLGSPLLGVDKLPAPLLSELYMRLARDDERDAMNPEYIKAIPECVTSDPDDTTLPVNGRREKKEKIYGLNGGCIEEQFDPSRWLCVVGTRYEDYPTPWETANRVASRGKGSDGLILQSEAKLENAPLVYLHKIHSGYDSLMTCRETYETATRFFFGDWWVELILEPDSRILNFNKKYEYHLGCSIKTRDLDFYLTRQDYESVNCQRLHDPDEKVNRIDPLTHGLKNEDDDFILYSGALDLQRSKAIDKSMMFRVDIKCYSEAAPSLLGALSDLVLGHSDNLAFSFQIIVEADTKSAEIRWCCCSEDEYYELRPHLEPYEFTKDDTTGDLSISGLTLYAEGRFDGSCRLTVRKRT